MQRYNLKRFWMMKEADDGVWVPYKDYEKLRKELTYTEERLARREKSESVLWGHVATLKKDLTRSREAVAAYCEAYMSLYSWKRAMNSDLTNKLMWTLISSSIGWGIIVILLIMFSLGVL